MLSPQELTAWRIKSGMTREEHQAIEEGRANGNPYNHDPRDPKNTGITQMFFADGRPSIFKHNSEPGSWRWFSNAELVPIEQLPSMLGGTEALWAEMQQRMIIEDRETAREILAGVLRKAGGQAEVERRGAYALVRVSADEFDVTRDGMSVMPAPTNERLARVVFDELTPAPITAPPETTLAEEMTK